MGDGLIPAPVPSEGRPGERGRRGQPPASGRYAVMVCFREIDMPPAAKPPSPRMANSEAKPATSARYPLRLLALFLAWWLLLAVAPVYRQDWLLENLLVFIAIPVLMASYRRLRLSDTAYTLLFVFFALHELGAHYTYSEVPYDRWAQFLSGRTLSEAGGLQRNHYDRLVHFLYGLLVTPAVIELLDARAPQRGIWRWLVPLLFMVSHSTVYELVEWAAAEVFGGDLGQAYLGTQGDVWDAQRDSALAGLGAAISVIGCRWRKR